MLSKEQIAEQLASATLPNWHKNAIVRAIEKKLGKPVARYRGGTNGGNDGEQPWEADQKLRTAFDEIVRQKDALAMLVDAFPRLEVQIRAAWNGFDSRPYQDHYSKKPFRAPGHALTEKLRYEWARAMLENLHGFDPDIVWLAGWHDAFDSAISRWTTHEAVIPLLIAALDGDKKTSDAVFDVLKACASGLHEVGQMSHVVARSLLGCSRPDAWEFVEKLLLAAQREEGLRQSILESIDLAHPQAFRRMLRLIIDEKLVRFSATVRAVDVWFGFNYDAMAAKHAEAIIESVLKMLDDRAPREKALAGKDGEAAYLALWCIAFEDAVAASMRATKVLTESKAADVRFAATQLLSVLQLPSVSAALRPAMQDADLRVAMSAFSGWASCRNEERDADEQATLVPKTTDVYRELESLLARLKGKRIALKGDAMPWSMQAANTSDVLRAMIQETSIENADALVSHIERMDPPVRRILALTLAGRVEAYTGNGRGYEIRIVRKKISPIGRQALLQMLGDAAKEVRDMAAECFAGLPIAKDEVARLEELLERKASDLRTSALSRILKQDDAGVLGSARRLLDNSSEERRSAGLEVLEQLIASNRSSEAARAVVKEWKKDARKTTQAQGEVATRILSIGTVGPKYRLENGLGLLDDSKRIPVRHFQADQTPPIVGKRGIEMLWELHEFVTRNRELQIIPLGEDGKPKTDQEPIVLGSSTSWQLSPRHIEGSREKILKTMHPEIRRLLEEWVSHRKHAWNDDDRNELHFAWLQLTCAREHASYGQPWYRTVAGGVKQAKYDDALNLLVGWAIVLLASESVASDMVSWAEQCSAEPANANANAGLKGMLRKGARAIAAATGLRASGRQTGLLREPADKIDRSFEPRFSSDWIHLLRQLPTGLPDSVCCRIMNLIRMTEDHNGPWREQIRTLIATQSEKPESDPVYHESEMAEGINVMVPTHHELLAAWKAGDANEQDLYRWMLLPEDPASRGSWERGHPMRMRFIESYYMHGVMNKRLLLGCPEEFELAVSKVWSRAIEVELERGDAVTEVSGLLSRDGPASSGSTVLRALSALGSQRLVRGFTGGDGSKSTVFSALINRSRVSEDDTTDGFAALSKQLAISDERLLELAVYAPQWARFVERALEWPGLEDAVWWVRAHTKDASFQWQDEIRDLWDACIAERSPVAKDDFQDGAVDVDWFHRAYALLGKKRWEALYAAAKFACGGSGHKRAQLFADAILGNVSEKEITTRIESKRHQDSVRALGLIDLGKGAAREKRVLERYRLLQDFRRTSRKHGGSMLQASEKRAVEIGMENLARLAGYADPLRLQWAMETREIADLAAGPIIVKAGDIQVSLRITEDGQPEVAAEKKGKPLASVPPAAKKLPAVKELSERATMLRRQTSRMRLSLEQAMCRGDEFEAGELKTLAAHPVLWPMLERLVFAGEGLMGYPDKKGAVLRAHDSTLEPLKSTDRLRLAHPVDFLNAKGKSKAWELWQRECFSAERVQPFKQVFRELYIVTQSERDKTETLRYQGQQIQPRQALALFGARGWVAKPEEGVFRTFHQEKITAHAQFEETFYTPAEIEGLTTRGLVFTKRGSSDPLNLADVPPRLFSEVMRDLDLVVSVAHRGGVDPEASQSSIEMRASLLREVCLALKLNNVRIEAPRAFIKGVHREYALHLGSANVQMLPGAALFIVPVHSHHRGRVFLPFAEEDPKCAEVITKAIALARDSEIKDPSILTQLRAS